MYCPKCSQPQVSEETQFCSGCGLPLSDLKEMISRGAKSKRPLKDKEDKPSPRQKGMRQGLLLMLLSVILVPAYVLLAALFPPNDRLVESAVSDTPFEKISQAILFTVFLLGLVRTAYAYFFQKGAELDDGETEVIQMDSASTNFALPPARSIPVTGFGKWRASTGDIAQTSPEHEPGSEAD